MTRLLPALVFLAACATPDNRTLLAELEQEAAQHPRPELMARVLDPSAYRIKGARRSIKLPLATGKAPIVRAAINGVAMDCIVDTGTTHVVMSAEAARACGLYLPNGPSITLLTPGYEAHFRVGAPVSIELGGMRLEGGVAIVPETRSTLARRLGVRSSVHATIGTSVLSNFNVEFDFGKRELELSPHNADPFAGVMWTEVSINGLARLMLIDSGANGIFLEPEYALALGLISEGEAKRLRTKSETADSAKFGSVRIDEIKLGSKVFRNLKAHIVEVADHPDRGGLLGIAGLGPHRWKVDYENKQLVLLELR